MARSRTLSENESDNKIPQYDSDEATVVRKESDNEESLNLERVFQAPNENSFLIGHSSRFCRSAKLD